MYDIFDSVNRTDGSVKKERESYYEFLNRSASPEMVQIREFVTGCVLKVEEKEAIELVARLRSGDDTHFKSAMFELLLHEALLNQGCKLEFHPSLGNGSTKHPDFLVTDAGGEKYYLEAVLASEKNDHNEAGLALIGAVFDKLNETPHHDFMLSVDYEGFPETAPSAKKLKHELFRWLNTLDVDELLKDAKSSEGITDSFDWNHENCTVRFKPIPLVPDLRKNTNKLLGASGPPASWIDISNPIKSAVKKKGGRYGDLDHPLVVAVNTNSFYSQDVDEIDALFGDQKIVLNRETGITETVRERNGAWTGLTGPRYRGVSAVWLFSDLSVFSLNSKRRYMLYVNPWATQNIPESLRVFEHSELINDELNCVAGLSLLEIFVLSENWPYC